MYKARRDRHQQKLDQRQHHEELEECAVPDKARERFPETAVSAYGSGRIYGKEI